MPGTTTTFWTITETAFGPMFIAGDGRRIRALKFHIDERRLGETLAEVERELGPAHTLVRDDKRVAGIAAQVREYLAGKRTSFDVEIDVSYVKGFRREVLEACAAIRRGETTTYAELARRAGRPAAFRAVGNTMATNPIAIVIPCHRVLGSSNRGLGGYGGGLEMKTRLLALEGVTVRNAQRPTPDL